MVCCLDGFLISTDEDTFQIEEGWVQVDLLMWVDEWEETRGQIRCEGKYGDPASLHCALSLSLSLSHTPFTLFGYLKKKDYRAYL
jgi:hypothetical protein